MYLTSDELDRDENGGICIESYCFPIHLEKAVN